MKNKFFFFIFKYNYRKKSFNNFIKIRKIKNYRMYDFSGFPKYYIFGYPLYFLTKLFKTLFKNFTFISCDSYPQLKLNGVNIWFGGPSIKVPEKYKSYKNNCFVIENFVRKEENLLNFFPAYPSNLNIKSKPKIVFIGDTNTLADKLIDNIWNNEKENIMDRFSIIDERTFWHKYNLLSNSRLHYYYIQLKERLRLNLILNLNEIFNKDLIVVGNKWNNYLSNCLSDEYDISKIKKIYHGNLCLDFGSKWGNNPIYPRSVEIIESGGLLIQAKQLNFFKNLYANNSISNFSNLNELIDLLKKLLNKENLFYERFKKQYDYFNNFENNYFTFTKIFEISRQNNINENSKYRT